MIIIYTFYHNTEL